jgi:hypothetical protein
MTPAPLIVPHDPPADDELGCGAGAIAMRVRRLIARHDGGDVCAAAQRLGVRVRDLIQLEGLLSEPSGEAAAAEQLLVAVVLRYPVNATWLLTGSERPATRALPPTVRIWLADLLLAVGTRIVDDYRVHALTERETPRLAR